MTRLVYSTGPEGTDGRDRKACPRCGGRPCRCAETEPRDPAEHAIVVHRERRGRRGKTVTLAGPFHLSGSEAAGLLKRLKRACGCGGTLKRDGGPSGEPGPGGMTLEIQGDQMARVAEHLAALGYRVKQSGQ